MREAIIGPRPFPNHSRYLDHKLTFSLLGIRLILDGDVIDTRGSGAGVIFLWVCLNYGWFAFI
jgi:hypothetical protein